MSPTKPIVQADEGSESTRIYKAAKKRYRLVQRISAGLTSTVWRARDTVSGEDVVVKRLEAGNAADPVARQRLQDEGDANERVSHPNSVPLLDRMFDRGQAALVFPYVPGRTLADRLRAGPRMTPREAAGVALQIADVLAAAHSTGLVHRDVKPANILLGDDGRTRLVDFGISAADGSDAGSIELTADGMAVGTLPYMAPEQLTGGAPAAASDVYALGVVTYEMLAGARPFDGKSPAEQLQLQHGQPARLEAPAALTALVGQAMDPLPERRPSAAQMGRSLSAWLDGRFETDAPTEAVPVAAAVLPVPGVGSNGSGNLGRTWRSRAASVALLLVASFAVAALALAALGGPGSDPGAALLPGDSATPEVTQSPLVSPTASPAVRQPVAVRPAANPTPAPKAESGPKAHHHHGHHHKKKHRH
jgi:serine/threonine protein kinase